jgi:hypothetical protein
VNSALPASGFIICKQHNTLRDQIMLPYLKQWHEFGAAWDHLPKDPYLLDGGKYRYRRYSVFHYQHKQLSVLAIEPHFQARSYNTIHGGIDRHLATWKNASIHNPVLQKIIAWVTQKISTINSQAWRIQAHQFRIVAARDQQGKPTPEGIHKDGADYIFIMLLQRKNIQGGVNHIYDNQKQVLAETTLENSADCILLDDAAVYHYVSEISVLNHNKVALRDVLVLTFHRN